MRITKRFRPLLWVLVLGMMAVIFFFSCQGSEDTMQTSGLIAEPIAQWLASFQENLTPEKYTAILDNVQHYVRKAAHFTEYALLGVLIHLLMMTYGLRAGWAWAWLAGTVYATTDEIHQLLTGERSGMVADVLLDSAGVIYGALVIMGIVWLIQWGRSSKQPERKKAWRQGQS